MTSKEYAKNTLNLKFETMCKKVQKELFSGIGQMETYARENYWMKRDSEDLYIFVEEGQ